MIKPLDLVASARRLATPGQDGSLSDADVRRAISTAYYALFHAVAAAAANQIVGLQATGTISESWAYVYRAIDHGTVKRACMNSGLRRAFAPDMASFAVMFETMQTTTQGGLRSARSFLADVGAARYRRR